MNTYISVLYLFSYNYSFRFLAGPSTYVNAPHNQATQSPHPGPVVSNWVRNQASASGSGAIPDVRQVNSHARGNVPTGQGHSHRHNGESSGHRLSGRR